MFVLEKQLQNWKPGNTSGWPCLRTSGWCGPSDDRIKIPFWIHLVHKYTLVPACNLLARADDGCAKLPFAIVKV